MADITKHDPLDDGLVHFQLLKYCMNTCSQYLSANVTIPSSEHFHSLQHIHLDRYIANNVLQKGTRGLYKHWSPDDINLATAMIQMPHDRGGYGMTPNTISQISTKVVMAIPWFGRLLASIRAIAMVPTSKRARSKHVDNASPHAAQTRLQYP